MPLLAPGTPAPDFELPDADGKKRSLSSERSRGPVLLVFYKISCPTCQFVLPFVDRLWKRLWGSAVTVLAVSQDPPDDTAAFNREFGMEMPSVFDGEEEGYPVSEQYGIAHVPALFLVEPDGVISYSGAGWVKAEFEELLERLAGAAGMERLELFEPGEDVPDFRGGCASKN